MASACRTIFRLLWRDASAPSSTFAHGWVTAEHAAWRQMGAKLVLGDDRVATIGLLRQSSYP
jgi:hypothetical protein